MTYANSVTDTVTTQASPTVAQLVVSPKQLDFGLLPPGVREEQEFQVDYTGEGHQKLAIAYDGQANWFRLISIERVVATEPFPLTARVAIATKFLAPGRRYDGSITLRAKDSTAQLTVTVNVANQVRQVQFLPKIPRRLALLGLMAITVSVLAGLAALGFTFQVVWQPARSLQPLASAPAPSTPIPAQRTHQLLFVIDEDNQHILYLAQADGTDQHSLNVAGWSPVWSPDGKEVAFLTMQKEIPQLYLTHLNSDPPRQLTDTPQQKFAPAWSPDGKKLAFLAGAAGQGALQIIDTQQTVTTTEGAVHITQLLPIQSQTDNNVEIIFIDQQGSERIGGETRRFDWSPDSQSLLFDLYSAEGRHIYRADIYTHSLTMLTDQESWDPAWSPDGTQWVAASQSGIYRMARSSYDAQPLTTFPAWSPRWSPDGKQIAFLTTYTNPQANQSVSQPNSPDLWVMEANGGQQRRLTTLGCLNFAWSPDGKQLAYITGSTQEQSPTLYLWVITPGSAAHLIAEVSEPYFAWQ